MSDMRYPRLQEQFEKVTRAYELETTELLEICLDICKNTPYLNVPEGKQMLERCKYLIQAFRTFCLMDPEEYEVLVFPENTSDVEDLLEQMDTFEDEKLCPWCHEISLEQGRIDANIGTQLIRVQIEYECCKREDCGYYIFLD